MGLITTVPEILAPVPRWERCVPQRQQLDGDVSKAAGQTSVFIKAAHTHFRVVLMLSIFSFKNSFNSKTQNKERQAT